MTSSHTLPTLAELGIDATAAKRFRLLARIPDEEFEQRFGRIRESGARIAKVDFYRLVKPHIKAQKQALKDIREAYAADEPTPVFAAFEKATVALVKDIAQVPTDELAKVGTLIRGLVEAYNAARAARA